VGHEDGVQAIAGVPEEQRHEEIFHFLLRGVVDVHDDARVVVKEILQLPRDYFSRSLHNYRVAL
jgi:hypothetical protein